eukprot:TRINITY_DN1211_c1_g1_i1.p1 TRINITY_DN1211_c1_g1~~TRINITY_DN1211_c1_g1_i1.p1  ORF type:complete len:266 (-),score=16.83 TRINITY_DN1211_c1_g1_i1:509-1306(-)
MTWLKLIRLFHCTMPQASRTGHNQRCSMIAYFLFLAFVLFWVGEASPVLSKQRMVFQTEYGDIEMAFYPEVAPKTVEQIMLLGSLGGYNTNHFFRVDKGFVAQVLDVKHGRLHSLDDRLREVVDNTVPLEVQPDVKHHTGVISMGRHSDKNSGTSSFSILLGDAPHLDMEYTIFGEVTKGMEVLHKMEQVETRREGIFVMPKDRITIHSSYVYPLPDESTVTNAPNQSNTHQNKTCQQDLQMMKHILHKQQLELEETRRKCLPGK